MTRRRLLDLFCKAGGATRGYQLAGFYVVGVDIEPQPRYVGDEFHQADAMTFPLDGFDAVHASPPCQGYSEATPVWARDRHALLIPDVRARLEGRPYIIENVAGARRELQSPLMLCGTMFGLQLWRHRYFETGGFDAWAPASCNHERRPVVTHAGSNSPRIGPVLVTGVSKRLEPDGRRVEFSVADVRAAMDIDWMVRTELDEAIPWHYTFCIGKQLMAVLA